MNLIIFRSFKLSAIFTNEFVFVLHTHVQAADWYVEAHIELATSSIITKQSNYTGIIIKDKEEGERDLDCGCERQENLSKSSSSSSSSSFSLLPATAAAASSSSTFT